MPRSARPMAKYPQNGDIRGRVRSRTFDLPPVYHGDHSSPDESAEAAFEALPPDDQAEMTGFIVANYSPTIPRTGDKGISNVLKAAGLAQSATDFFGQFVPVYVMVGAFQRLQFRTLRPTPDRPYWSIAARPKDS